MKWNRIVQVALVLAAFLPGLQAQEPMLRGKTSYAPVAGTENFQEVLRRMSAAKGMIVERQRNHLAERYDISDRRAEGVTMSRGKSIQAGVRVRFQDGVTWEGLASLSPMEIRERGLWPLGFLPLPHPNHAEGGMLFPQPHIDEIKRQTGRDLTRFDLDFTMPEHFLPDYPPAIFLTTRPDLGDVSQGKVVTTDNYFEIFNGILNPKQFEGLRLLVTAFPQQQFNATHDRRSVRPSLGVSCFDCHVNGHPNAATHLVGDIRPQEFRHRLDTPSLRGVNIQPSSAPSAP